LKVQEPGNRMRLDRKADPPGPVHTGYRYHSSWRPKRNQRGNAVHDSTRQWPVREWVVVAGCWGRLDGSTLPWKELKTRNFWEPNQKEKESGGRWSGAYQWDRWCHGEAASESGIRCQLQGWCMGSHHTMHRPAFAPFFSLYKIVFLVRKRWCRAVKPSLRLVIA